MACAGVVVFVSSKGYFYVVLIALQRVALHDDLNSLAGLRDRRWPARQVRFRKFRAAFLVELACQH